MSDFRIDLRVRFAETDAMGVAHHAAYLPYLESARVEYLRALGHPYRELRDRDGLEFAVVGIDLRYHAPLRFDDAFTVTCALAERACSTARRVPRIGSRRGWPLSRPTPHRVQRVQPVPANSEPPMRRLLAGTALAAAILVMPATALAATKPIPVTLSGTFFDNKPNVKLTVKLGASLRFVWDDGFHNVVTQKAPAGAGKVNTGDPTADHKPVVFKPTKKGKYSFYCVPHRALGMLLTLTVR